MLPLDITFLHPNSSYICFSQIFCSSVHSNFPNDPYVFMSMYSACWTPVWQPVCEAGPKGPRFRVLFGDALRSPGQPYLSNKIEGDRPMAVDLDTSTAILCKLHNRICEEPKDISVVQISKGFCDNKHLVTQDLDSKRETNVANRLFTFVYQLTWSIHYLYSVWGVADNRWLVCNYRTGSL